MQNEQASPDYLLEIGTLGSKTIITFSMKKEKLIGQWYYSLIPGSGCGLPCIYALPADGSDIDKTTAREIDWADWFQQIMNLPMFAKEIMERLK